MAASLVKEEPMDQDGTSSFSDLGESGLEPPNDSVFFAKDFGREKYQNSGNKAAKKTFYCRLCDLELSSLETRISHEEGQRHLGKIKSYKGQEDPIIQIENEDPIRTPDVEVLATLLEDTTCKAFGLIYIKEFKPESYQDRMPPFYKCTKCYTEGSAAAMFNHVVSAEHGSKVRNKSKEENKRARELIKSYVSDELYPWPVDKAPWSLEMGGDGQCPFDPDQAKEFSLPSLNSIRCITKKNRHYFADMLKQVTDRTADYLDSKSDGPTERTMAMRAHADNFVKIVYTKRSAINVAAVKQE